MPHEPVPIWQRHRRVLCWVLLAANVVAATALLALVGYLVWEHHAGRRGALGPLYRSSPRSDPPPLMIRPHKTS